MFWRVKLHGTVIDTVWFNKGIDAAMVKASLVNHDGYDPDIEVEKAR